MFIINIFVLFSIAFAYQVPQPKFKNFPTGFSVSIPDEPGIELFAFHGNINKEMQGLEAGQFSKDILRKSGDNEWIFEDQSTILKPGDKIYYWLFVIKQRLGYRFDNGLYIVNVNSSSPLAWIYDVEPSNVSQNFNLRPKEICQCNSQKTLKLEMENQILYELMESQGQTMKLLGKFPAKEYANAKDFVQSWIASSLLLSDIKVISAELLADDLMSFKVDRVVDKVKIIMAAKSKLNGTSYRLL